MAMMVPLSTPTPPTPFSANLIPQVVTGIVAAGDAVCGAMTSEDDCIGGTFSDGTAVGNASSIVSSLKNDQQVVGTLVQNVSGSFSTYREDYQLPPGTLISFKAMINAKRRTQIDIYLSQDQKEFYGVHQTFQNLNSVNTGTIIAPLFQDIWQNDATEVRCGEVAPRVCD